MKASRRAARLQHIRLGLVPFLIFVAIMAVTLVVRYSSFQLIEGDIEQAHRERLYQASTFLQAGLQQRILLLRRVAGFVRPGDDPQGDAFARIAGDLRRDAPDILSLVLTEENFTPIRVSTGPELSRPELELLLRGPSVSSAARRAATASDYAVSARIALPVPGDGFSVIVPAGDQSPGDDRADDIGGERRFVFGVFLSSRLQDAIMSAEFRADYGIELYPTVSPGARLSTVLTEGRYTINVTGGSRVRTLEDYFFIGPQLWTVRIRSVGLASRQGNFLVANVTFWLGATLALILAVYVYQQQLGTMRLRSEALDTKSRLVATGQDLAQIHENLNLILNNVDEAIILYDEDMEPVQVNAAYRVAFGSDGGPGRLELGREHHASMSARFQNDARYWSLFNNLRENPERPVSDELTMADPANPARTRYFQRRATSVSEPDGSRRGYLVIYQDITPSMTVEKLKDDFLAGVTHDLRTPLSSIKGFASTMLGDEAMDAGTRREFTQIIQREAARLEEMIEDLLDVRRMESGRTDLAPGTVHLRGLVEDVIRSSRPLLDLHGVRAEIEWEGDDSRPLSGDVSKLTRCVRNVLGNAIKYSPEGSRIRVRGSDREDRVELEITDQGPGAPEEELPRIFEKFYRGSRHVRRTKGTGLGLTIVKHIVESHGGVVTASNAPEGGMRIRITLPRDGGGRVGTLAGAEHPASNGEEPHA